MNSKFPLTRIDGDSRRDSKKKLSPELIKGLPRKISNRVYEANKHGGQCNPRIPREWKERKGGNFPRGEINSTSECVPRIRFPLDGILQDLSSASVFQETIHTREKEREDEKKRSRDYSTPFLQPLNDAKKDRTGFLRRPEARPYWPVSIEIRTCASRPRRRL